MVRGRRTRREHEFRGAGREPRGRVRLLQRAIGHRGERERVQARVGRRRRIELEVRQLLLRRTVPEQRERRVARAAVATAAAAAAAASCRRWRRGVGKVTERALGEREAETPQVRVEPVALALNPLRLFISDEQ